MIFTEEIKYLREKLQIPQRQLTAVLEIDTATYCKIEKGERRARREQVIKLADLFHLDSKELLTFWLADQITAVITGEKKIADKALDIAKKITK